MFFIDPVKNFITILSGTSPEAEATRSTWNNLRDCQPPCTHQYCTTGNVCEEKFKFELTYNRVAQDAIVENESVIFIGVCSGLNIEYHPTLYCVNPAQVFVTIRKNTQVIS